jgi:AcrR family transcriptional regulator
LTERSVINELDHRMAKLVDKKEKRERILEAAISVFAKKGTAKTKAADIAESAQIGKGTIYEYFESKDSLIAAAFNYVMEKAGNVVASRISTIEDPWEKFVSYLRIWKEIIQGEFKDYMEIMLDFWAEGIRTKKGTSSFSLENIYDENRTVLQKILDECVDQDKIYPVNTFFVSSIILGALDGLMIQWIIQPGILDIDKSLDELEHLILRGLKKEIVISQSNRS